jgi:Pleckstrin homology domain
MEGILIRKHHMEHEFTKAKSRSWKKMWCVLRIHAENSLELAMYRVTSKSGDREFDGGELADQPYYSMNNSLPSNKTVQMLDVTDKPRHPVFASDKFPYKLASTEPELISIIHSFACFAQYGDKRSNVFLLHLSDGSAWLFQAPNEPGQEAWVNWINYYAGRKSKHPMRGGMSSNDYGWSNLKPTESPPGSHSRNASELSSIHKSSSAADSPFVKQKKEKHKLMLWTMPSTPTKLISSADQVFQDLRRPRNFN